MVTMEETASVKVQFPAMAEPYELALPNIALFYLQTHADSVENDEGSQVFVNPRPVVALSRKPAN